MTEPIATRTKRVVIREPEVSRPSGPRMPGPKLPAPVKRLSFGAVLRGEFLADEKTLKRLPFLLFLSFLGLIYIANAYYVERKVVAIQKLNKRVKDLHTNYVSVKAELMFSMKQTEIASKMAETGLKESTTPPKVIRINESNLEIY